MKRFFTFFLTLILSACCLLSFTACNDGKKVDNNSVVNPRTETIKVGVVEYAPLNYTYKNTYRGFNTELAVMTFNALGYNVEFVLVEPQDKDEYTTSAEDVYDALDEGDIDCFWGGISDAFLFDETRADFSHPYLKNPLSLVQSTFVSPISSLEDLENNEVAFGKNSAGEVYYKENLQDVISGISSVSCERGQTSALHKVSSIASSTNFAIVDTLLAYYQKYNGEYSQIVITDVDLDQEEYFRVVFKKEGQTNELRDNVNAMLETFAKIKTDDKCIITQLAEKYKFNTPSTTQIKSVADFIITDFTSASGGENGGSGLSGDPGVRPFPWI